MGELEVLNEGELIELWQQLRPLTQKKTKDCGDVALETWLDSSLRWNDTWLAMPPYID